MLNLSGNYIVILAGRETPTRISFPVQGSGYSCTITPPCTCGEVVVVQDEQSMTFRTVCNRNINGSHDWVLSVAESGASLTGTVVIHGGGSPIPVTLKRVSDNFVAGDIGASSDFASEFEATRAPTGLKMLQMFDPDVSPIIPIGYIYLSDGGWKESEIDDLSDVFVTKEGVLRATGPLAELFSTDSVTRVAVLFNYGPNIKSGAGQSDETAKVFAWKQGH
jgi:hypothetical protein